MSVRVLVWGENVHEQSNEVVKALYPEGMHAVVARAIAADPAAKVSTATLQEPDHGCTEARLAETDVLVWWGHVAHGDVRDEIVERIARRVWEGLGLIVLHSGHFSKIFKRLMGTPCALQWREAGERERLWVINPAHPIAKGLPAHFEIEHEEMYGEPFSIPEPLETVFISWFQGGEVFRSSVTYRRGAGKIFYFRPGHETYPTYYDERVGQVLRNAVNWANSGNEPLRDVLDGPNVPAEAALEPIVERGAKLHGAGGTGYR